MLTEFGTGQGFLKAGLFGFAKSGKSFTSALLAIRAHRMFGLKTPIAAFDSEAGIEYISPMIEKGTGMKPVGIKSRSFKDLLDVGQECEAGAAEILLVDSISHPWRELCKSYLDQVNAARDAMRRPRRTRLEFQDWDCVKNKWRLWTDFYLNSRLHIIFAGRAAFEWDFEEVEDTAGNIKKELRKTGVKVATEKEFGFEASLLIEMERVQVPIEGRPGHFSIVHRATVLGDRFDAMDGVVCDNPTGDFFMPHLSKLVPGAVNMVDTMTTTDMGVDEAGDAAYYQERKEKTKLLEEIQGEMIAAWPGQKAEEKRAKVAVVDFAFGTKSWTAVEGKSLAVLRAGLTKVRNFIASQTAALTPEGGE